MIVTVTVDEGASFDLGELRLSGEWPVPAKEMLKVGGLKTGDLAKFDEVDAAVERMKKRLRREGYMRAGVKVERIVDDEKKTVALDMRPELGPQFTFGTLTLKGLDIHGEAAIKKLWGMKEGKPFNADYPSYFLEQIKAQGVFDELGDTSASLKTDEQTRVVDVTLNFRPASTESGAGSRATSRRPVP